MRSRTPPDLVGHCGRCTLKEAICICEQVPSVTTRTQVVIVRHATEAKLTSNSGRLAHLALENSLLLTHGEWRKETTGPFLGQIRSSKVNEAALPAEGSLLLFGSNDAKSRTPVTRMPQRLVVLDGTYRQARRMYKQIKALRGMPDLSLPAPVPSIARLRKAPHREGMATLEAVAHALDLLEGEAVGRPLHQLYAEFVQRTREHRGIPGRSGAPST